MRVDGPGFRCGWPLTPYAAALARCYVNTPPRAVPLCRRQLGVNAPAFVTMGIPLVFFFVVFRFLLSAPLKK